LAVSGPVAQGIEQQPSKLKVAGSNPAGVANKIKCFSHFHSAFSAPKTGQGGMGAEPNIEEKTMATPNKWGIPGWGAARAQISFVMEFLCEGKTPNERAQVVDGVVELIRAIGRGNLPNVRSDPRDTDEHSRESWALATADQFIGGILRATERSEESLPTRDQIALLRQIAKLSLWHMPNSRLEVRELVKFIDLENIKQPHPKDDPPGRD
jgi:hypothetical protein